MNRNRSFLRTALSGGALLLSSPLLAQYSPTLPYTGHIGKTVQTTQTVHTRHNPVAPEGAPNVIWILIDDLGFGASSAFGGGIQTPTFEYLAQNGLRFTNFHTTSISAPTRASLLTGRNHHSSHVGEFNDDTYDAPGYDTYGPMENGTIAEVLRENGYNTWAIGKYNYTPVTNGSDVGPFNRWPTGRGFDHFFGYNAATCCDDQWHPYLYRDTQREPDDSLHQLAITRFTNQAIDYIAAQKTADPDKPFFLYFAPGTAHWPHQTTPEWINKYKGKFDAGWDEYARQTLANQIRLGLVPQGTKLPPRNKELDYWKNLSQDEKTVFERQMELYAGYVSQADYEIGRLVDYLRSIGQLDNTVIIAMLGDNGAEGVGRKTGVVDFLGYPQTDKRSVDNQLKNLDKLGSESSYPFYAEGWAAAMNTPFRYYKGYADYEGGTHNGMIVFAPKFITDKGGIRTQFTHVSDVLPTTVELTGTKVPEVINGYKQNDIEGTSFAYAVEAKDNSVENRHHIQYFELGGSYALYKDGWKALFPNDKSFEWYRKRGELDSVPHLYNLNADFNETKDLAKKYPEKIDEFRKIFDEQARKYNVYPLKPYDYKDPSNPKPTRTHFDILFGTKPYTEFPYFDGPTDKSYLLTAETEISDPKTNGVLFSYCDEVFYLKDGKPVFLFVTPVGEHKLVSPEAVPTGRVNISADLALDKATGHITVSLLINGRKVASKDFGNDNLLGFSSFCGPILQIGRSWGKSVTSDYESPNIFQGKYLKATIDLR